MKHLHLTEAAVALFCTIACLITFGGGCGYSFSSSPYRLNLQGQTLRMSVPVATNHSRYGHLGPALTKSVIERLSGIEGLIIDSNSVEASLTMNIVAVSVGSGSWDVIGTSTRDTPEASSSRTATITVDATIRRPNPETGAPLNNRSYFSSSRTYMVSPNQGQSEMQEAEAMEWIIDDIGRKIATGLFNEF
ncbi:MAG: LPS assembly lipoprotein LptE [Deltaproteobacteria bacterium]|nr:LPS assembly lipoprotein LptE [Deltaproteobacteria bacterium]